jgi:hypothetical protein
MADKINMVPKQSGEQLMAAEFNNIISKIDLAIDEVNETTYNVGVQNNAIAALALLAENKNVTYEQLMTLIGTGQLIPGKAYRITDFATVHYLVDGNANIIQNTGANIIITGTTEPLTVLATSVNTLSVFAYSALFPGDIIKYDPKPENWLNQTAFSADGLAIIPGFKGVIYRREDDTKNIRCNFDFRNAKVRMYSIAQPLWAAGTYLAGAFVTHTNVIYVALAETLTEPIGNSAVWRPLVNIADNKYLSFYPDFLTLDDEYQLPVNAVDFIDAGIFEDVATNSAVVIAEDNIDWRLVHIKSGSAVIKIGSTAKNCIVGHDCSDIVIGESSSDITVNNNSTNVRVGALCNFIFIGNFSDAIELKSNTTLVVIFDASANISVAQDCNNIYMNTSGSIIIGQSSMAINIGYNCQVINIGYNCQVIDIGNTCQNLRFASLCTMLIIPANATQNVFEEFVSNIDYTDIAITQVGIPMYVHHLRNLAGSASQYYMSDNAGTPTLVYFYNIINTISD